MWMIEIGWEKMSGQMGFHQEEDPVSKRHYKLKPRTFIPKEDWSQAWRNHEQWYEEKPYPELVMWLVIREVSQIGFPGEQTLNSESHDKHADICYIESLRSIPIESRGR